MKKRVLLVALMVVAFACLFAISVSAETVSFKGQDITVTRITATASEIASKLGNSEANELKIMDEDAYVVLKGEDGKLYAFPSYYIINLATGRKENCEPSEGYLAVSEIKYDFLNAHSTTIGTTFKSSSSVHTNETGYNGAIRYIEFPEGLRDQKILVVDDLFQSGASLFCFAEYLKRDLGARDIIAVTSVKAQKDGGNV